MAEEKVNIVVDANAANATEPGSDESSTASTVAVDPNAVVVFDYHVAKSVDTKLKGVTRWEELTEKDVKESTHTKDYLELKRFLRFRSQTETFLMQLGIAVDGSVGAHKLSTEFENSLDGALFDALLRYDPAEDPRNGRSTRSFEFGPALDNILFTSLSQKLDGFRLTRFKNAVGPQRTIRALRALSEEFEISRDDVERSAKEKLKKLRLDNKTSISKYCSLFKGTIEACEALGLTTDFDTLRDQFEDSILEKREKNIILRKEFVSPEVRNIRTIGRYLTEVVRSIHRLYRMESGVIPYDASPPLDGYYTNSQTPGQRGNRRGKQFDQNKKLECGGCGGAHYRRLCPHRNKRCNSCHRIGHIAKHCRNKSAQPKELPPNDDAGNKKQPPPKDPPSAGQKGGAAFGSFKESDRVYPSFGGATFGGSYGDTIPATEPELCFAEEDIYAGFAGLSLSTPAVVTYNDGYIDNLEDEILTPAFTVDEKLFLKPRERDPYTSNCYSVGGIPSTHAGADTCCNSVIINESTALKNARQCHEELGTTFLNAPVTAIGDVDFEFLGFHKETDASAILKVPLQGVKLVPDSTVNLIGGIILKNAGVKMCLHVEPPHLDYKEYVIPLEIINGLYCVKVHRPCLERSVALYSDAPQVPDLRLWHRRLMHANIDSIKRTLTRSGIDPELISGAVEFCHPCWATKFDRTKLKVDPLFKTPPERIRQFVHMDFLVAPRAAIGGYRYGLTLIDAKCKYVLVVPSHGRTATEVTKRLHSTFVNDGGFPELIILDRDSPFISAAFADWCAANNIQLRKVPQARHEFNGLAENVIKVLQSRTTSALIDAQLPASFWMYALLYSAYVRNRTAHSALEWKTPFEAKTGMVPRLSDLRVFGCVAYKKSATAHKFEPNAVPGIFVGLDSNSTHGTYMIMDPETSKVSTRFIQDVRFNEGLTWHQLSIAKEQSLKAPPPTKANPKLHNDPYKDLTDEQKKLHAAVIDKEDIEVEETVIEAFMSVAYGTVKIVRRPETHVPKQSNAAAARRAMAKQREKAVKAGEPLSYRDIANHPEAEKWKAACDEEDRKQLEIGTYDLIPNAEVPAGTDIADCKRVFKKKRDGRLKVRNTIKGNKQKTRLMDDFASPVVQPIVMMIALQIAVARGWGFATFDVETAFLNAPLPEGSDFYMRLPEGHAKRNTHIAKLRRAIYGMKEAGRLFFELLATVLLAAGFEQSTYDPCLFYCAFGILLAHVDDCLILGDESFIDRIFAFVKRKFNITTTGFNEEVDFIGCWIRWNGSVLEVSQEAYIDKILARFDLEDCREYSSPLTPGTVLYPSETPCDFPVFSWNGSLMFCRLTRFDILYALNQFSRVLHAPSIVAKQQMLRCFGYLKATKKFALRFYPCDVSDLKLTVMSDSDWASNHADRKSVGGDLIYLGPSIVGFLCRTQSVVAPSSQSAEVIQVYVAVKRLKWIKAMLEEMELTPLEEVVPVLTDSDNAVKAICTITDRNKHLGLYLAYIRDLIKRKVMSLHHISREWNYADLFTKQDAIKDYQRFRKLAREPLSIEYVDNKQGGMKDFQK